MDMVTDPSLTSAVPIPGMAGMSAGIVDDMGLYDNPSSYEVFDPLNWMLDGLVGYPYESDPT